MAARLLQRLCAGGGERLELTSLRACGGRADVQKRQVPGKGRSPRCWADPPPCAHANTNLHLHAREHTHRACSSASAHSWPSSCASASSVRPSRPTARQSTRRMYSSSAASRPGPQPEMRDDTKGVAGCCCGRSFWACQRARRIPAMGASAEARDTCAWAHACVHVHVCI